MVRLTRCVDCLAMGSRSTRAAPKPGPRCLEHWRAEKRRRALAKHAQLIARDYGITAEEYQLLLDVQNGVCAICRKATGAARRLAVDHDHETGVVRGLLCKTCNYIVVGRYSAEALQRAVKYLQDPPAVKVIGRRIVPRQTVET